MKRFLIIMIMWCTYQGHAQNSSIYFDDRDSNGTGLVLYSNGLFECDYRNYYFKTLTKPPFYLSRGIWHPIDSNLIELKSFDEYKPRIVNVIKYRNPKILDSIKIQAYNKDGELMGYAYMDGNNNGESFSCSVVSIFARDDVFNQGYYKKKDIINLPYDLTYDRDDGYNQYYFIISADSTKVFYSYHDCIIEIYPEKKQFRVIEIRERINSFNPR